MLDRVMPRLQETPAGEAEDVFPVMRRADSRVRHRVVALAASVRVEAVGEESTLSSRELFERGELGGARSGPRQHVVQCEEHCAASGATAAVEMDPVSIANDPLDEIDESNERLAPRRAVVGHR